jgi:hypothetical protein
LHEIGEDADLAMIDVMVGEGQGDGVEVVQDGGVVFHVGKADEGLPDVGVGKVGAAGAEEAAAAIVVVAEFAGVVGGHGAAGSAEGDAAAAAEGVGGHWVSLDSDEAVSEKREPSERRVKNEKLPEARGAEKGKAPPRWRGFFLFLPYKFRIPS